MRSRSDSSATPTGPSALCAGVAKTLGLIPGRATFVIDREGIVRHSFSSQFRPAKHVAEALAVLAEFRGGADRQSTGLGIAAKPTRVTARSIARESPALFVGDHDFLIRDRPTVAGKAIDDLLLVRPPSVREPGRDFFRDQSRSRGATPTGFKAMVTGSIGWRER